MKWDIYIYNKMAVPLVIDCTQGSNDYEWEFTVKDYKIPTGAEIRVYMKKPSGNEIYNTCVVTGDTIKVKVTTQMTAEHGKVPAQFQIIPKAGNADNVKPFLFWLNIEKSLAMNGAIESKDEIGILDQLIIDARKVIDNAKEATGRANEAGNSANEAAERANTAAEKANTATDQANTATQEANEAAERANTAAEKANTATDQANTATQEANEAAERANTAAENIKEKVGIDDKNPSGVTTYSSQKIEGEFLKNNGDASKANVTFEIAAQRANILPGDTLEVAFGKLAKFCSDLKAHAFADPVRNLTTTETGKALDATMGKQINDDLSAKFNALNSAFAENFDVDRISLTNSSYYPTSFLRRSGQVVHLQCAGLTTQEIPANSELVIAVESNTPESFRPITDIVAFPNISQGKCIRLYINKEGRITLKPSEKLVQGFGINLHFTYITGRSIM